MTGGIPGWGRLREEETFCFLAAAQKRRGNYPDLLVLFHQVKRLFFNSKFEIDN